MKEIKWRSWDRSTWILVIIGILVAAFLIQYLFLWIFWVYGPISHPGAYEYGITVTGLSGFTGGDSTRIDIPFPEKIDNTTVFRPQDIDNRTSGIWTSRLVSGSGGPMIRFSTSEQNLTDIHAVFYRKEEGHMDRYRDLSEKMSPYIENATTPYTRWIYNQSPGEGPVTRVAVDSGLKPHDAYSNLTFDLEFTAGGGVVSSQPRDWYRLSVVEDIPAGVTGSIPVRVQIGKQVNNRWVPFP